ncbi:MAG: chloride channel protein [Longimicrobiales bacterium]
MTPRMLLISLVAVGIGVLSAFVALALLRLIGLFTNLFFFGRWNTTLITPAGHDLGAFVIVIPALGGLIIGVMARYGSERIRGHGIPEAIESILIHGSRVQPRLALLKPVSSAISIGSGGPFGAEGPIIMTGGAFGSLVAQLLHLTDAERKTLLVAGAAAGMSATFATPLAAVLLSVELLLFEWKPRSVVPVAVASIAGMVARRYLLGMGPIFATPEHLAFIGIGGMLACVLVGALAGALSAALTGAVYFFEDAFARLPIHWMWWPALGGLVVGLGGYIFPEALGVGYDVIERLLQGDAPGRLILGVLLVKSVIWSVSLGSGTSGGVLAPLLMMGGALGAFEATFLPDVGAGFWALVSMGAVLGGMMRSPLTAVVFAFELTHDVNVILPLLVAAIAAHAFSVLAMKRSVLTEKVSRRGYHLSREYAVDALEIMFVREAMRTNVPALPLTTSTHELAELVRIDTRARKPGLHPVVDDDGHFVGVVTRSDIQQFVSDPVASAHLAFLDIVRLDPIVTWPDEPLRLVVERMAETGYTRLPVVDRASPDRLVGMITLVDLLKARTHNLEGERRRQRVLDLRVLVPQRLRSVRGRIIAMKPLAAEDDGPESR